MLVYQSLSLVGHENVPYLHIKDDESVLSDYISHVGFYQSLFQQIKQFHYYFIFIYRLLFLLKELNESVVNFRTLSVDLAAWS